MFSSVINTSIFENALSQEAQRLWDNNATTTTYDKGQILFHEGTQAFGVFILKKGKVKLYKTGDEGKKQIFQICVNNDIFGFHPVLSDEVYPDSASTLEKSTIQFLTKKAFISLIKTDAELCFKFMQVLSKEFSKLIEQETILAQKPVRERVALVLYSLNKIYQNEDITFSRQDLADMSGTVKETFVRVLKEFKDASIITSSGRSISILQTLQLKKIANIK